jgi:hypothetical protein
MNAINVDDYILPDGLTDEQLEERLADPLVRICNLYWIKDADGNEVQFRPNYAQACILHAFYIEGILYLAVPKSRQMGVSTVAEIMALDETLFSSGKQASIVERTKQDAENKLKMVGFAFKRLPDELRDATTQDNLAALGWANGSVIYAGMSARGGTNQFLHISEWGPIAFKDPKRSSEILTGALPTVSGATGKILAESTHMGGKGGDWYDLVTRSLTVAEEHHTAKDFRVLFFPWYDEPRYTLAGDPRQISKEIREYLAKKEAECGVKLTDGQKLWYFKIRESLKRDTYREYPTTIDECWMAPSPGAIYAQEVDKARMGQRITNNVLLYSSLPVYTVFDIGAPANTFCWVFQVIADRISFLECMQGGDECKTPAQWAMRLKERPYRYASHFLPHDGAILWLQLMIDAGLSNVVALQKPLNIWDNINSAVDGFSRCVFNLTGCQVGIDALEAYHSKQENDGVTIKDVPVHDWSSHASTAFGYAHQAIRLGMIVDRSAMPSRPKRQHYGKPNASLTQVGASMTGLKRAKKSDDW